MATKAEGERAGHGFGEGQFPEAAEAIRLGEAAAVAEAVEMDRATLSILARIHFLVSVGFTANHLCLCRRRRSIVRRSVAAVP